MDLKKFDFPLPDAEEIKVVKELAESCPELLDGRDVWIWRKFIGGDFE